jgi:RNA polymerase sigma-70 factor (ECF subfamily)
MDMGLENVRMMRAPADSDAAARELDALMRAELPRVERLLVRILGPRQDLDDLVQTVFFEVLRAWPRFRGDSSASTFVGGIAVRVARRAMRLSAWRRLRGPMPEEAGEACDAEQAVDDAERMRRVRRALDKIGADKRIAFVLWALEGMEPLAIAELTGCSLSAARSRIFHAQKELKAIAARDPLLREALGGRP